MILWATAVSPIGVPISYIVTRPETLLLYILYETALGNELFRKPVSADILFVAMYFTSVLL